MNFAIILWRPEEKETEKEKEHGLEHAGYTSFNLGRMLEFNVKHKHTNSLHSPSLWRVALFHQNSGQQWANARTHTHKHKIDKC